MARHDPFSYSFSIRHPPWVRYADKEKDEPKGYLTLEVVFFRRRQAMINHWCFHKLPTRPMVCLDLLTAGVGGHMLKQMLEEKISRIPPDSIVKCRIHGSLDREGQGVLRAANLRRLAPDTMNITAVPLPHVHTGR